MRLFHKLLILIGLVLVFEIFFILVVLFCVNNIQQLVVKQSLAQQRLNYTIRLIGKGREAGALLGLYSLSASWNQIDLGIEERFENAVNEFEESMSELADIIKDEPKKYHYTDTMEMTKDYVATLRSLKKKVDVSREKGDISLMDTLKVLQGLQATGDSSVANFNTIERDHRKLNEAIRDQILGEEKNLSAVLIGGVVANGILVMLFGVYLNRNLGRRFDQLRENCLRYAGGRELAPPMPGSDEISELDSYFRKLVGNLIESTAKLQATFDNADDIICTLDHHGVLTEQNPAFARTLGYTEYDTRQKPLIAFASESGKEALAAYLEKVKKEEVRNALEAELVRADESPCDFLLSIRWVDREQSYFVVGHDISERKQLEKTKQEFLAIVSHELRSPLTSVSGILHMLGTGKFGDLSDKGTDRVKRAESSVERLIGLINNLLDAEQLGTGKMRIVTEPVLLSDIISSAVNSVSGLYDEKAIALDVAQTDLTVIADRDRIVQVLVNLLSNAVKFSPANAKVRITVERLDKMVEIGVEDEGPGIPEDSRAVVFERFKQLNGASSNIKGSGLGLAICRSIVEAHDGAIDVTGRAEGGSRFWLRLALSD